MTLNQYLNSTTVHTPLQSSQSVAQALLVKALIDKQLYFEFESYYRLPNGGYLARNFQKNGWHIFDDGHVCYRSKHTGSSNFDGETVKYLNAILDYFDLIAERQEDGELVSYFRLKS